MSEVVRDPEILGGMPVFRGTRVPARNLFECLMRGGTIEEFLEDFPTVSPSQVHDVLHAAESAVESAAA